MPKTSKHAQPPKSEQPIVVMAPPAKKVKRRLPARPTNLDVLREVVNLRSDFVDLKQHVNDELQIQHRALEGKLDRSELNLFLLWKQSPAWLKVVGAIATISGGILAAVAGRIPI